jgi:hypothetical protein
VLLCVLVTAGKVRRSTFRSSADHRSRHPKRPILMLLCELAVSTTVLCPSADRDRWSAKRGCSFTGIPVQNLDPETASPRSGSGGAFHDTGTIFNKVSAKLVSVYCEGMWTRGSGRSESVFEPERFGVPGRRFARRICGRDRSSGWVQESSGEMDPSQRRPNTSD